MSARYLNCNWVTTATATQKPKIGFFLNHSFFTTLPLFILYASLKWTVREWKYSYPPLPYENVNISQEKKSIDNSDRRAILWIWCSQPKSNCCLSVCSWVLSALPWTESLFNPRAKNKWSASIWLAVVCGYLAHSFLIQLQFNIQYNLCSSKEQVWCTNPGNQADERCSHIQ